MKFQVEFKEVHIHLHMHNGQNDVQDEILERVEAVHNKLVELGAEIMASMEQFQAALQQVDQETTRIGNYIQQLLEQLNRTDLTDAQEEQLLAAIGAAADRLRSVGTTVENPVPPGELPEVPV